MKHAETKINLRASNRHHLFLAITSLASLIATFLISNSNSTFQTKLTVFVLVVGIYLITSVVLFVWKNKQFTDHSEENSNASIFNDEIEAKLLALEEAHQFFGTSLKPADMFRLISSRINEIIPFTECALYLVDVNDEKLKIVYATGESLKKVIGTEVEQPQGLAGKVFYNQKSHFDEKLVLEKAVLPDGVLQNLNSAIAVPLAKNEKVFGVFVLYGERADEFNRNSLLLLEAIGTRVAALFLTSQAFENSLNNALTDTLTNLPNERAFFLVLENQIAESQRYRDERPLAILAIDIKNFNAHNQRFGHAVGDRLLLFVSNKIKNQLRQMDFLTRSKGDEFLAVLPTASEKITREIVERIEKIFISNPFKVSDQEKIHLQLHFGIASFGKDGETASQLLTHAVLRKTQSKSAASSDNILWFPKEFVN